MNWALLYSTVFLNKLLTNGFQIILIIFLIIVALKLVNAASKKLVFFILNSTDDVESEKKIKTFRHIIKSTLDTLIIAIGSMLVIEKMGINIGPIIAAAGVIGVAVGFGSRQFVEDIISGMIILATDQIRVGDVVQIGDKSGLVEKVDLKMVVLRDISGNVHFIRNGKIDSITNMTKDFSYYLVDIGFSNKEDIDKVVNAIKEVDENLRNDINFKALILEPVEILGLDKFNETESVIKARIKTKPIKQWTVGNEFNLGLKKKFDELGLEKTSFSHKTLLF